MKALIKAGADVNSGNPLDLATKYGHETIVKALIEAGADVNKADSDGRTPVRRAFSEGSMTIVRILLDAGAEYGLLERCVDWGLKSPSALGALASKYPRLVALSIFLFVNGALVYLSLVAGLFNIMVCIYFAFVSFVLVLNVLIFTTCPPDNNSRDTNNYGWLANAHNVGNY